MAGYSSTPLARKLGIKPECRLALLAAPDGFEAALEGLPDGVVITTRATAPRDVIVAFFSRRRALEHRFARLAAAIHPAGGLWIAWPKRASGVRTDITEDVVREIALANGLVDNKVCAIDATWSGLRLVFRVEDRGAR